MISLVMGIGLGLILLGLATFWVERKHTYESDRDLWPPEDSK